MQFLEISLIKNGDLLFYSFEEKNLFLILKTNRPYLFHNKFSAAIIENVVEILMCLISLF